MNKEEAIKEYQCSGCVCGSDLSCFTKSGYGDGCGSHCPGTLIMGLGTVFLGMPKGFNRVGPINPKTTLIIYESFESFTKDWSTPSPVTGTVGYDMWNIPVWKYLDEHGNTLIRGLSPRTNTPFLHVILGDCRDKIECLEITKELQKEMD